MATCAFFGHIKMYIEPYVENLIAILTDLIENKGVTEFYCGNCGQFDFFCSQAVYGLKKRYPFIKMIMVLYYPDSNFCLPYYYDESVYLLPEGTPKRFAVSLTNRLIGKLADYIVCGIVIDSGSAYHAVKYALYNKKPVYNVIGREINLNFL